MTVHPCHPTFGNGGRHHRLAARHRLNLYDAERLRLLHRRQAEKRAGGVVCRQVLVGHPSYEQHLVLQPEVVDLLFEVFAQRSAAANHHHTVVGEIARRLHQIAETLVGHQTSEGEDYPPSTEALPQTFRPRSVRLHRLDADGQMGGLVLHMAQEGRLGDIHRRGAYDDVGTPYQPFLHRQVHLQQAFLPHDVAVPVQHHPSLVARAPKRQTGRRIGMVNVDDVVVVTYLPQHGHHGRGDHRRRHLLQRMTAEQAGAMFQFHGACTTLNGGT